MHKYPDVSIIPMNGKSPRIHDSAFIAPGCRIIAGQAGLLRLRPPEDHCL